MKTQDLTNNKERIIKKIKYQITLCTQENIKDVMVKMVAYLPRYADKKPLMSNIDKITNEAISNYIKYYKVSTVAQRNQIEINIEKNKMDSRPSNLQY